MNEDKINGAKTLLEAMSYIDDDIIEEAAEPYKRRSFGIRQGATVAACVALIAITAAVLYATLSNNLYTGNSNSADGSASGASGPLGNTDDTYYVNGASLTPTGKDGNLYTFTLSITEKQERIDISLYGSGVDEYGNDILVISTTAPYAELTHIPIARPKITVDGKAADEIPTDIGNYEITVDFSDIDMSKYLMRNYFTVYPFGNVFR